MPHGQPTARSGPRSWWSIAAQTVRELDEDDCLGLAAQLAFYFLLSLFPGLLFAVAILGFLPLQNPMTGVLVVIASVTPPDLVMLLTDQLQVIAQRGRAELATLGLAAALWSSSAAMAALIKAMNRTFGVEEQRPWWKRRILALAMTVVGGIFFAVGLLVVLSGTDAAMQVARSLGSAGRLGPLWSVTRWLAAVVLLVLALDVIYFVAPNRVQRWRWASPGSIAATTMWIACSFGFKVYVSRLGTFSVTYGAIGGVIVVLIWLYLSGLSILVGAEFNHVLASHRQRP